jgi:hypothetical protein
MFFCCYFCHEAEIRYQDVSFPTLVFVKAMSPILVVPRGAQLQTLSRNWGTDRGLSVLGGPLRIWAIDADTG